MSEVVQQTSLDKKKRPFLTIPHDEHLLNHWKSLHQKEIRTKYQEHSQDSEGAQDDVSQDLS